MNTEDTTPGTQTETPAAQAPLNFQAAFTAFLPKDARLECVCPHVKESRVILENICITKSKDRRSLIAVTTNGRALAVVPARVGGKAIEEFQHGQILFPVEKFKKAPTGSKSSDETFLTEFDSLRENPDGPQGKGYAFDSCGGFDGWTDYTREELARMGERLAARHAKELAEARDWAARDRITIPT